jgi:hypothetical protein
MNNSNSIGFQLIAIHTEQFAIIEQEFDSNKPLEFAVNFNVAKNDNQKLVSVLFSTRFMDEDRPIMILECSCHFKLAEESWAQFVKQESTTLIIPKAFITHLAVITVGTARGILHSKTEGTKFNGYLLPTLNLVEIFTEDTRIV